MEFRPLQHGNFAKLVLGMPSDLSLWTLPPFYLSHVVDERFLGPWVNLFVDTTKAPSLT